MPIYPGVCQKVLNPTHLCTPFPPLHIALSQLIVLGFARFLQHTAIIVLFCGMFFTIEIEKSLMLPCLKLRMKGISLRGRYRTLRT